MKKKWVFCLLILFQFFAWGTVIIFGDILFSPAATVDLIKREIISQQQLDQKIRQLESIRAQAGITGHSIEREKVLESMIAEVLIKQGAERANISVSQNDIDQFIQNQKNSIEMQIGMKLNEAQFRELVARETGLTWFQFKDNITEQLIQQTYIMEKKGFLFDNIRQPTDREILSTYRDNATLFTNPEYIRMSHIFISIVNKSSQERETAKNRINDAYRKLRQGAARFDDLVLEYSEDTQSKFQGGDVGYIGRNDARIRTSFGPIFFDKIFSLEERQTSEVIQSNLGYHIVRITEQRKARILELDDPIEPGTRITVREYIKNVLIQERNQQTLEKALDDLIAELKKEAEIRIFE